MTVNPITLDLRNFNQAMSSNIANMQVIPCINVNVSLPANICSWIMSIGGWDVINAYHIMALADAYLGQGDLGFPVTMTHIAGGISYYLKRRAAGNLFTECDFQAP